MLVAERGESFGGLASLGQQQHQSSDAEALVAWRKLFIRVGRPEGVLGEKKISCPEMVVWMDGLEACVLFAAGAC